MQNPTIVIGTDMNKEYTDRKGVSTIPNIIGIPPMIINDLVFILVYPVDTSIILQM